MISDKIAFLRSQHGMTQTELARHCGVSLSTVKNWETGLTEPHLVHIRAICSALKVNADFLLDISESPVVNLDGLEDADIAVIKALVQHLLNKNEHSQQRPFSALRRIPSAERFCVLCRKTHCRHAAACATIKGTNTKSAPAGAQYKERFFR